MMESQFPNVNGQQMVFPGQQVLTEDPINYQMLLMSPEQQQHMIQQFSPGISPSAGGSHEAMENDMNMANLQRPGGQQNSMEANVSQLAAQLQFQGEQLQTEQLARLHEQNADSLGSVTSQVMSGTFVQQMAGDGNGDLEPIDIISGDFESDMQIEMSPVTPNPMDNFMNMQHQFHNLGFNAIMACNNGIAPQPWPGKMPQEQVVARPDGNMYHVVNAQQPHIPMQQAPHQGTNDPHRGQMSTNQVMDIPANEMLPQAHIMDITIHYSTSKISKDATRVDAPEGCVIYYDKHSNQLPENCVKIKFPGIDNYRVREIFKAKSPKLAEITGKALGALTDGLRLRCVDGGIFARRETRGKIYWTSTEEANNDPQELSRKSEKLIFNFMTFRDRLTAMYKSKCLGAPLPDVFLPAIYFTFAQKWNHVNCPINTCLIWVKVVPFRAYEMAIGLFPTAKTDTKHSIPTSLLMSSPSGSMAEASQ